MPACPPPSSRLTALGLLDRAKALGVPIVQIAANRPLDQMSEAQWDEPRNAVLARGLTLGAGTHGVEPAHLRLYFEICVRIGARILRTLSNTATYKPSIEQRLDF